MFFLGAVLLAQALPSSARTVSTEKLLQLADHGDLEAPYWLCYRYWDGEGLTPDYPAAVGYCQKAASREARAKAVLGCMYRRGQGLRQDYVQARQLLIQASAAGVPRADYELGLMSKNGEGILPKNSKAEEYFCRAAQHGECRARAECPETRSHLNASSMAGSAQRWPSQINSRGLQGDCHDTLSPEAGEVVGPESTPMSLSFDQIRQISQNSLEQFATVGQIKVAAAQAPSASAGVEVSLNKAVSLQIDPLSQNPGSAARVPKPSAAPIPAVAPSVESRLPLRPLVRIFLAVGLLSSMVGCGAYFFYRSSLCSSCRRMPVRIRSLLSADPQRHQEISDLYGTYCRMGGQAEVFSGDELQAIVVSLDAAGSGFPTPGLSCAKALAVAGKLAAAGKMARMQDVLCEPMLVEAAASGRADEVLVLLARSKNVNDFAAHFSAPGRPADFYSAYASGLARLGLTEQAYKMLTTKPLERFSPADQALLLELHVKLGHFDEAGLLLDQVIRVKPPAAAKDYYEELAKQATMHGGQRLAEDLRTIASGRPIQGAPARPPARSGKVLAGKYELRALISSGGMGEVYDGYDRSLDRHVAIKRLLPGLLVDPLMRAQFLREAKTAAHLTHPYIVPIYESLVSGDDLYLVFEFVKGETLYSVLSRRSRLALKECQGLFYYICYALDYAHRKHVLHRDLKPSNIMLDENGIARIMDFGIAVEASGSLSATFVDQRGVSGTLRYMPPEQHYGKTSRASDIYSLGVCLYEMATGYLPFNAPTILEVVEQKHKGEFPAPSFHVPELPQEFDALILQALAPDPKVRMQSSLELYAQLAKIEQPNAPSQP